MTAWLLFLPAPPASSPAAPGNRRPSPGAPRATVPRHRPPAAFDPAGPAPGQAPSTAPPGPPGADPDPGPRLRHRALTSHQTILTNPKYQNIWPNCPARQLPGGFGLGAEETRWRRSEGFIAQSPGCSQSTFLEALVAWQLLPCRRPFWPCDILGTTTRPQGRGKVTCAAMRPRAGSGERLKRTWRHCRTEQSHSGRAGEPFVSERLWRGER
jgi:hypothetical protein